MKPLICFAILVAMICYLSCSNPASRAESRKPLIVKDSSNEAERNNTLFVFVGEKINVKSIPYKEGQFDHGIEATYKVLQHVYGHYDNDIIEFKAYDHYGTPEFTKYKTVLLFVSEYKGAFYQEKYMFD